MAFLADDGRTVYQALWSRSPFLCWAYQSALAGELLSSRLQVAVVERWPEGRVRETIKRFERFRAHESPGFKSLTTETRPARRRTAASRPKRVRA